MLTTEKHLLSELSKFRVVSLDVFDTVLTRTSGPPEGHYLWLGNRLLRSGILPCSAEVFARARLRVEREVWRRAGGMDTRVTLTDFYRELTRILWIPEALIEELVLAELKLEAEVLWPIPQGRNLIECARDKGVRVVFISDTYFSGSFLEEQLKRHDLWSEDSVCLSSIDFERSKASGRLFDSALKSLNLMHAGSMAHAGDNPHSDVHMPRSRGIKPFWLNGGRLNRYERLLAEERWATAGLGAALAGASRMARLATPSDSVHERAIRDVAAGVAAPFLLGYVLWLLRRARECGLDRLYFLARDGQVLKELATSLVDRLGWDIEVSYLFVSRQSTNLAATFSCNDEELGWVFRDRAFLTARELFARFDLAWNDVEEYANESGLSEGQRVATDEAVSSIKRILGETTVRTLILERARQRRSLVRDYLEQEGVFTAGSVGLVDFGGVGSQIRALHSIIVDAGAPPPRLLMVGLDDPSDAGLTTPSVTPEWLEDTECYLYDHRRGLGIRRKRGFGTCVQMFCSADHGTTLDYRRSEERVEPVLATPKDVEIIQWGLPTFRRVVQSVADSVVLSQDLVDYAADLRDVSCALIDMFWTKPTREEALAWGAFPFEGAQAGATQSQSLAHRYSWAQVVRQTVHGAFPNLGWQHWYEGSVALSPRSLRIALRLAESGYRRLERADSSVARSLRAAMKERRAARRRVR